jgi:hypothetical protein
LIILVLTINGMGLNLRPPGSDQQLTDGDLQEARQLAIEFTTGFLRKTDLTPLVKELFISDFIERYKSHKSKDLALNSSTDLYFVPGLDYNSRLLAEAGPEDWLRFYTAANNFVFFGFVSGIKNSRNAADIKPTEMYPPSVIKLLATNETLANMIVRKGKSKAVSSVAEMHRATATLDQAGALMRQQWKGQSPVKIDEKEMIKAMQEDEFFKPILETVDDQFFGLDQGSRVIFINTPILFRLILVKANNSKLEILWAEPYTGD